MIEKIEDVKIYVIRNEFHKPPKIQHCFSKPYCSEHILIDEYVVKKHYIKWEDDENVITAFYYEETIPESYEKNKIYLEVEDYEYSFEITDLESVVKVFDFLKQKVEQPNGEESK